MAGKCIEVELKTSKLTQQFREKKTNESTAQKQHGVDFCYAQGHIFM